MTPDPGATVPDAGRRDLTIDDQEYRSRLALVRGRMSDLGLDVCLVSTPENILWLTGLDHWGYFAPHLLVVPTRGEMVLVTRAMEQVTVANQVRNAAFAGHPDSETVADVAVRLLRGRGAARIGLEAWSSGLPPWSRPGARDPRCPRLRHDSDLEIRTGMSFHILSWLMGTGCGDAFVSDTVLLTEAGPEVLTTTPRTLAVP